MSQSPITKKIEEHQQKPTKKPELHKQHESKKTKEKKHEAKAPTLPLFSEGSADEEPYEQEENDDDEYYEVDDTRHILKLPMHFGGNFHHNLPEPEHHHFSPMSNYQGHPYFAARQNRAADDFRDANDFFDGSHYLQ